MKLHMKFMGSEERPWGKVYYWESREYLPGDSRVVQYSCNAKWFWNPNDPERLKVLKDWKANC